jgi:hypothetical protein
VKIKKIKTRSKGKAIIAISMAAIMVVSVLAVIVGNVAADGGGKYNVIEKIAPDVGAQTVLRGQDLQFDGWTKAPTVSRVLDKSVENTYMAQTADGKYYIYDVNWPSTGAYYVGYTGTEEVRVGDVTTTKVNAEAQLSVEDATIPLSLKVGTKKVASIAEGTPLKVYTGGINLFTGDKVDLVIIGPDGQIKTDTANNQKFTGITVAQLMAYGNKLITNGWSIGDYTFQVKSRPANACGLEVSSKVRPLKILKGEISIDAEPTSTIELDTVTVTVTGVAGDIIEVKAAPCDGAMFKDGVEDTPRNAGCRFEDTIDTDGIRKYAIKFNDTGTYTLRATVEGGSRDGDYDTVDITVSETGVVFDLPSAVVIGEKLDIKGIANTGTYVDVFIDDVLYARLHNLVIEADGTFSKEVITTDVGMTVPGLVTLKAWLDSAKRRGESPPTTSADGSAAILVLKTHLDATITNATVAPGDSFDVFGNASSDYVEIVLLSPDGGNGTGMDGLYGTTIYTVPTFCNSTNYFNNYYKKLKVDSDADNGNYAIIVLNPGRDNAYGDSEYTYIDSILDPDGDGPEPGVTDVSNMSQKQIAAIISDMIFASSSDDFMWIDNIVVA